MNSIFQLINRLFQYLCYPMESFGLAVGMIWISLVTGLAMLIIFKFTSNQSGIQGAKKRVGAYIIEMRLFSHDLGKMLLALGRVLAANLFYLRFMLFPILIIIVPVFVILVQTSYKYEYRALKPHEAVIVKAVLKSGSNVSAKDVVLRAPDEVRVETPPVRVYESGEIYWRISAAAEGVYNLRFIADGEIFKKNIHVGGSMPDLSARKVGSSFIEMLLYHSEPFLPVSSPFSYIQVLYPKGELSFAGWKAHWIIWFLIFSIIFSFAFKNAFKVEL